VINGFQISAGCPTGSTQTDAGYAIVSRFTYQTIFTNIDFGICAVGHMYATRGTVISPQPPYSISGSAPVHFNCGNDGTIVAIAPVPPGSTPNTVTIVGTLAFSNAFALANIMGNLQCTGLVWSGGTVTGTRYNAEYNGIIYTNNAGPNYFPGSIAGTTIDGGLYY
jgi:hypothetical protein